MKNNKINYNEEWNKLKERLTTVVVGFDVGAKVSSGIERACKEYASGVLQGVLEYMEGVENNNG